VLAIAFDRAVALRSPAAMHDLESAAREFVTGLRAHGLPPERVVVAVKALVRAGDRHQWEPSLDELGEHDPDSAQPAVYAELFHWCLEAYFSKEEPC